MPSISVIIPCYNQATYLSEAIESALAQMYHDVEVIVVNDGSTDDTARTVEKYREAIRYVCQENQGLSAARNAGLELATGDYVTFLDADDAWEPDFLASTVAVLESDERLAMCYTRFRLMDEQGNRLPKTGARPLAGDAYRRELRRNGFFTPNSALVRRRVLDTVGGFDTELTSLEDWDLWLRIAEAHEVAGLEQPLALYRVYAGSMSTNAARMHANRFAVLAKHFGPPEGEPGTWPADMREFYACAYRSSAYEFLLQGDADQAWALLTEGAAIWPSILTEFETYYQFACGDQPRAIRGDAALLDLRQRESDLLCRLDNLFKGLDDSPVRLIRRTAFGRANRAMALLNDQAGDWKMARHFMKQAFIADPELLADLTALRHTARLMSGKQVTALARRSRATLQRAL